MSVVRIHPVPPGVRREKPPAKELLLSCPRLPGRPRHPVHHRASGIRPTGRMQQTPFSDARSLGRSDVSCQRQRWALSGAQGEVEYPRRGASGRMRPGASHKRSTVQRCIHMDDAVPPEVHARRSPSSRLARRAPPGGRRFGGPGSAPVRAARMGGDGTEPAGSQTSPGR